MLFWHVNMGIILKKILLEYHSTDMTIKLLYSDQDKVKACKNTLFQTTKT